MERSLSSLTGRRREGEEEYRKRMVVPLWSHMTNLCLLQGVWAAGQSQPSLSLSLYLYPSLSFFLSLPQTHAFVGVLKPIVRMCFCVDQFLPFRSVRIHEWWLHALLSTEWRPLSLTMSLLCCFSLRDYGSKRKSGKSPVFFNRPPLMLA